MALVEPRRDIDAIAWQTPSSFSNFFAGFLRAVGASDLLQQGELSCTLVVMDKSEKLTATDH